jgi:serine/threonine-protein kinase
LKLVAGVVVADRFRLERQLGQGGMGEVWLAHHIGLDIPCALKFIHAHAASSTEVRERFEREARGAAQLRSPNVVQILDHGVWEHTPYIAMELLEGEDLSRRLKRQGMIDIPEIVAIVNQVARALTRARAAGLVHRDLKPANIFLVKDDDREIAKVLDFGVAKSVTPGGPSESRTETGALLGTPFYMSPEQAQGTKLVDYRSDLWALGVITFQCLTGQLPFHSAALGDLLVKIIVAPIPRPSEIAPVPPEFDAWWDRASARDPAERFQSARELAEALALALGVTRDRDDSWADTSRKSPVPAPSEAPSPMVPVAQEGTAATAAERLPPPDKALQVSMIAAAGGAPPRASRAPLVVGGVLAAFGLGAVGVAAVMVRPPTRDVGPAGAAASAAASEEVRPAVTSTSVQATSTAASAQAGQQASRATATNAGPAAPHPKAPAVAAPTGTNLGVGAACASASQCVSGFCVDAVCCDSACTSRCMACTGAKKFTGNDRGSCGYISGGEDPDHECGAGQRCTGMGQCATMSREQIKALTGHP